MITNFKTTSISEELAIMNMADVDFTMWGEPAELAKDEYYLETFNHRREMEAKGYVLNPHFDENMAWWKDKHSDRPYDKFLDFDCNEFVKPEELQWYEDMRSSGNGAGNLSGDLNVRRSLSGIRCTNVFLPKKNRRKTTRSTAKNSRRWHSGPALLFLTFHVDNFRIFFYIMNINDKRLT